MIGSALEPVAGSREPTPGSQGVGAPSVPDDVDLGEDAEAQTDDLEERDESAADSDSDDVTSLKERIRQLEERAQRAEQLEQFYAEQQHADEQAQADAYWNTAYQKAADWYNRQVNQIYAKAEDAIAPVAFIEQHMSTLNGQWTSWLNQFHANREQSAWNFAMQQAIPNYARDVAEYYGLPQDVVKELMQYPPDLMPREAERIKKERGERAALKRKATQAGRQAQRDGFNASLTGGGGSVSGQNVELGSDEHYNSIPWTRSVVR